MNRSHTIRLYLIYTAVLCTLLMLLGLSSCSTHVKASEEALNCAIPQADRSTRHCSVTKNASDFTACLDKADVEQHTCIIMDTDISFCAGAPSLPITAIFNQSNRTLDCAGGIIDHGWGRVELPDGTATTQRRRQPGVRFVEDKSLSDVTVANCTIRGTNHMGIQATRFFGGQLNTDNEQTKKPALPVGHNNLNFQNLQIEDTITGIYLGAFSENVKIDNVHIDNSQRIAVYFEAGSHNVRIRDSIISNNQSREAVAIDSSYDNEITNTLFLNNREGDINLYQNCGELKGIVCPILRSTPPNNNRITRNRFVNTAVSGVQIASRQGRRHARGWCATLEGRRGKFTDTAQDNVVSNNTFVCHQGTSLVVKDGPNKITDNQIVAKGSCVPFELSTGGHGPSKKHLLDGLIFKDNAIESDKVPRIRNLSPATVVDYQ